MTDHGAPDRRQFFQRFRLRTPGSVPTGDARPRLPVDHLPSTDPAVVRSVVIDWQSDVAPSWEDGALVVFTQASAMLRWELSPADVAFLQPIDGQRSIGVLHDAAPVEGATDDGLTRRITLLTELLDAGVLRLVS